jgi:hypothetical protein
VDTTTGAAAGAALDAFFDFVSLVTTGAAGAAAGAAAAAFFATFAGAAGLEEEGAAGIIPDTEELLADILRVLLDYTHAGRQIFFIELEKQNRIAPIFTDPSFFLKYIKTL